MADLVLSKLEQAGLSIRLNRPGRRNALNIEQLERLVAALDRAGDDGVRAIMLSGTGGAFCSGFDIDELSGDQRDERIDELLVEIHETIAASPAVCLVAVEGPCIGAGLDLALAADFIVADPGAYFWLPAVQYGLVYRADAVRRLADCVGPQLATLMVVSGERVTADRAETAGLVALTTAPGHCIERCEQIVASLQRPEVAGARADSKRLLKALGDPDFDATHWESVVQAHARSAARLKAVRSAKSTMSDNVK